MSVVSVEAVDEKDVSEDCGLPLLLPVAKDSSSIESATDDSLCSETESVDSLVKWCEEVCVGHLTPERVVDWMRFDSVQLDSVPQIEGRPLVALSWYVFGHCEPLQSFVSRHKILGKCMRFVDKIEKEYKRDIAYHTNVHATDVAQAVLCMLQLPFVADTLCPLQQLVLYMSAIAHDTAHDGFNNDFHQKAATHLVAAFGTVSCLEKFHVSRVMHHMSQPDSDWLSFAATHSEVRSSALRLMEEVILATDMAVFHSRLKDELPKAFERYSAAKAEMESASSSCCGELVPVLEAETAETTTSGHCMEEGELIEKMDDLCESAQMSGVHLSDSDLTTICQAILHAADISNPLRPFAVARHWGDAVTKEFFRQGDVMRERGLDISFGCDKHIAQKLKLQTGFIDFFVVPFFKLLSRFMPELQRWIEQSEVTKASWTKAEARVGP